MPTLPSFDPSQFVGLVATTFTASVIVAQIGVSSTAMTYEQWEAQVGALQDRIAIQETKINSIRTQTVGHGQNRFDKSEQYLDRNGCPNG